MRECETNVAREARGATSETDGWVNGGITSVERRAGMGGQLVWETMSLERKETRGNKMMKSVTANGVDSAWDSLKDVLREIEAAVSTITPSN